MLSSSADLRNRGKSARGLYIWEGPLTLEEDSLEFIHYGGFGSQAAMSPFPDLQNGNTCAQDLDLVTMR